MKRSIFALLLLVLIIVFCSICVGITDRICDSAASLLSAAEDKALSGNFKEAENLAASSMELWESREGFLGMVLRHTESDDVSCMYPNLLNCCQDQDGTEFRRRSQELRARLAQLSRMEFPYFFNVL